MCPKGIVAMADRHVSSYSPAMPWIDPVDRYAKPPRTSEFAGSLISWSGELEHDEEVGRVEGFPIEGGLIGAVHYGVLGVYDSRLSGVKIESSRRSYLEISGSVLKDC